MAKMGKMGKVASLGGSPAQQAMNNAVAGKTMPMRSPGKPAGIKSNPPSVTANRRTKQPKGKGKVGFKQGNIPGIKRGAVANLK